MSGTPETSNETNKMIMEQLIRALKLRMDSENETSSFCDTDSDDGRSAQLDILRLKKIYESLISVTRFEPGDIVQWKTSLKNRRYPEYEQPAIVLEVLSDPFFDDEDTTASPYYREPLDLKLGFFDQDGDLVSYYFDSRRFEQVRSNVR